MSTDRARSRTTTLLLALIVPSVALVAVLITRPHWDLAGTSSQTTAGRNVVAIQGFAFHPATVRVRPGAALVVTNADGTTHTLSSQTSASFDTGNLSGGGRATITAPAQPGRYGYYCKFHYFMTGTLEVTR